jgi:hypothetical protein
MRQTLLIIVFLANTFCSLAQDRVIDYKVIADKEIPKYFDSSLINLITCQEVTFFDIHNSETWSPNIENVKFQKVKMKEISFTYSYFSKSLNDTFSFWVSVLKQKNGKITITGLEYVPICILKDDNCKFIKKDSAINIAIKDSILYPENLTSSFAKRYNKKDYYWEIEGNPIEIYSTVNRRTSRKSSRSRKYINATTGQLVSWQDYNKPD